MAHRLAPRPGTPHLEPEKIAKLLSDEFAVCLVNREQGQDDVGDMLAAMIRMKAPQAMIDKVAAGRDRSLSITIADDDTHEDAYLSFMVRPDDGILIGYDSAQHEAAAQSLLERCAAALGYQIKLV